MVIETNNTPTQLPNNAAGRRCYDVLLTFAKKMYAAGNDATTDFIQSHFPTARTIGKEYSDKKLKSTLESNVLILDEATAKVIETLDKDVFDVEFVRSGTEPSNAVVVDLVSTDVQQILDKEVYGIEFVRSGVEPQPSVLGENDAAGITTDITPASFSVKYRKCGTGTTKS